MRPRVLVALWLVVGLALWNGIFDLYVSRGAREYLQRQAEFELAIGPKPSMNAVMEKATRTGAWMASVWTVTVVGAGWITIVLARRRPSSP